MVYLDFGRLKRAHQQIRRQPAPPGPQLWGENHATPHSYQVSALWTGCERQWEAELPKNVPKQELGNEGRLHFPLPPIPFSREATEFWLNLIHTGENHATPPELGAGGELPKSNYWQLKTYLRLFPLLFHYNSTGSGRQARKTHLRLTSEAPLKCKETNFGARAKDL